MARKLVNTKRISHDEWLSLRRKSIGGSDSAVCVGMNPYSSLITLYADKKGMSKEKETTEAMRLGTDLEGYVAERWCEKTGKKVRNDFFMYADDEYPFLTANVDRQVVGENAGLECKTMNSFHGYNLEDGEIPSHYFCQVQHYMMVKGYDRMYLAILVFQKGIYDFTIERDDGFIKQLRDAEVRFWMENVSKNKMPDPDGSDSSLDTIKEIYPCAVKETEIAVFGLDYHVMQYKTFKEQADFFSKLAEKEKAICCAKLGDCEVGVGEEWSCSWKNQSRISIDSERLKKEMPDVYAKYTKVSDYRTFRTKHLKKKKGA